MKHKKNRSVPGNSPTLCAASKNRANQKPEYQKACKGIFWEDGKTSLRSNACGASEKLPNAPDLSDESGKHLEKQRLNRTIASTGFCSRRKADEFILAGKVKVNGKAVISPALQISPSDVIEVDGKTLPTPAQKTYLLLHKPIHTICTLRDPQNRKTVIDILPDRFKKYRLFPVGRLDYFSEGLLILTNDGELAQRMAHPAHHMRKVYEVKIRGHVPEAALAQMRKGMELDIGQRAAPIEAEGAELRNGDTMLTLTLSQGINRQIRRMCGRLGLTILRIKRVSQGPLSLGNLAPGNVRELTAEEINQLKAGGQK